MFHPVAFESRKLTQPESPYPPNDDLLKPLAVVRGLICSTSPSSCTRTTRDCNGYSSSSTSVTTRRGGSICSPSSSAVSYSSSLHKASPFGLIKQLMPSRAHNNLYPRLAPSRRGGPYVLGSQRDWFGQGYVRPPPACRQGHWSHSCGSCPHVEKDSLSTQRHCLAAGTPSTHCYMSRKGLPSRLLRRRGCGPNTPRPSVHSRRWGAAPSGAARASFHDLGGDFERDKTLTLARRSV